MKDELYTYVEGDEHGNDLKWDNLVATAELYSKNGNYSSLSLIRKYQGDFCVADGKSKASLQYYLMGFYCDLNGFKTFDNFILCRDTGFKDWKTKAHIDCGLLNKLFMAYEQSGLTDTELVEQARAVFVPVLYPCHSFSVDECIELLKYSKNGNIEKINDMILDSENRLRATYNEAHVSVI